MEILGQSKDTGLVEDLDELDMDICDDLNLRVNEVGVIEVNRERRIELAMVVTEAGMQIVDVVSLLTWKDFEGLIANILAENNFKCTESFRRRGTSDAKGLEIDVIGVRGSTIISVDAKMWGVRGGKGSALRIAAEKQKVRTRRLTSQLNRLSNKISSVVPGNYTIFPIMVTWLVEEVEMHEGVPVVPVFKLNGFIQDFETYEDRIVSYHGHF